MVGQNLSTLDDPGMLDDRQVAHRLGLTFGDVQRLYESGELRANKWQNWRLVSSSYLEERIREGIQLIMRL